MRLLQWTKATALLTALAVVGVGVAGVAFAQGRGPGGGGGGGGGPGEETTRNNLSVPAILVEGNPFGIAVGSDAAVVVAPEEQGLDPISSYPIDPAAFYYVQGVHRWQASCIGLGLEGDLYVPPTAEAAWGDNLTGEARLKTSSPIRVEVGLHGTNTEIYEVYGTEWIGWIVQKLEPAKLDRESAYGTLASGSLESGFISSPIPQFGEVRVYDDAAHLTIYNKETGERVVDDDASAEINSTGRIVYGYNLRVDQEGTYVIEFTAPNVDILNADEGTDGHTVTLEITVTSGGGGGKQGNKGGGGRPKNR